MIMLKFPTSFICTSVLLYDQFTKFFRDEELSKTLKAIFRKNRQYFKAVQLSIPKMFLFFVC